jgi:hypothetical protein
MAVTSRLTDSQVSVDTGITSSASQVLVLTVRNVEVSLWVTVFLSETKVNDVDLVASLANAHEEVVWLDITVDERLGVDVFDARDELIGKQKNRLQGKLAVAEVEQVLQTGAEEIQDHGIVITFGAKPADKWDSNTSSQGLVDTGFILQLGVLGLDALELDGNLLSGYDIGAWTRY